MSLTLHCFASYKSFFFNERILFLENILKTNSNFIIIVDLELVTDKVSSSLQIFKTRFYAFMIWVFFVFKTIIFFIFIYASIENVYVQFKAKTFVFSRNEKANLIAIKYLQRFKF